MATENGQGSFEWWAGRLAALERKASGEGSKRWVRLLDPVLFEEAKQSQMQVYCDWYTKHACGVFMLNGPLDDKPYAMTSVLGILDLDLPDARGKYKLRDLAQGARLNQVLDLLKPELRAGSNTVQSAHRAKLRRRSLRNASMKTLIKRTRVSRTRRSNEHRASVLPRLRAGEGGR